MLLSHHLVIHLKKIVISTEILPRLHNLSYRLRENHSTACYSNTYLKIIFSKLRVAGFAGIYRVFFFSLKSSIWMSKLDHLQEIIKSANKEFLL